jgi:hypothetical protein
MDSDRKWKLHASLAIIWSQASAFAATALVANQENKRMARFMGLQFLACTAVMGYYDWKLVRKII